MNIKKLTPENDFILNLNGRKYIYLFIYSLFNYLLI